MTGMVLGRLVVPEVIANIKTSVPAAEEGADLALADAVDVGLVAVVAARSGTRRRKSAGSGSRGSGGRGRTGCRRGGRSGARSRSRWTSAARWVWSRNAWASRASGPTTGRPT